MNIITRASVKERIHVEQIIRSQPCMEDYNVFVHSNKDSQDNGAPLAFASFCDDYPNREWTVFHI